MTRNRTPRPARGVLWSGVKWLPILLIPFSAFFAETWIQLQIFKRDYEAVGLSRQIKEVNARIEALEERADELMTLDKISAKAPDLGLVQPEPNQIEVVHVAPAQRYVVDNLPYELAQLPEPAFIEPPENTTGDR